MTVRDTVRGDQVVWEHAGAAFEEESRSYPAQMGGGKGSAVACGLDRESSEPSARQAQTVEGQRREPPLAALATASHEPAP